MKKKDICAVMNENSTKARQKSLNEEEFLDFQFGGYQPGHRTVLAERQWISKGKSCFRSIIFEL